MSKTMQAYKKVVFQPGLERIKDMCRRILADRVPAEKKQEFLKKHKEKAAAGATAIKEESFETIPWV
jgi:hypothetical protein